jgi:hypothetical protein
MAEEDLVPASQAITYRTTGSNYCAVHKHSFIFFGLDKVAFDFSQLLEISINHRSPDEKISSMVTLFDDRNNRYHSLGKLPKSDDFTIASYSVNISPWYSHMLTLDKPRVLQLSFRDGVSDIHSVTLQQGETRKTILQSIVLGDKRSEERPEVCMLFPEASNEWSKTHRITPRSSSLSLERVSSETLKTVGEIRHLPIKDQSEAFEDLIEDQEISFSDRLQIANFLGEHAVFKLAINIENELEDRVSATKSLQGAMKSIAARRVQEDLEDYTPRSVRSCIAGRQPTEL